ncbi:hypothetical protein [Flagellimonas aquimarina]|uniref:hypothetical protein n=1 Tax=Flagellimonas aquimarina TaxID=2201895 RepID=UPI0010582A10|nr:hypothetical protein [Allomuricauda koreensis]
MKNYSTRIPIIGKSIIFLLLINIQMGFSQNQYPSNSDVIMDGLSVRFKIPTTTSGWARGNHFFDPTGATKWGGGN